MGDVTTTGKPSAPTATRSRTGPTIGMAVLAVLLAPLGVMTSGGLLLPVGLLLGLITVALAALVLARTTAGRWPRRFSWALLVFTLMPWAFAVAIIMYTSFFQTTQTIPLPTG